MNPLEQQLDRANRLRRRTDHLPARAAAVRATGDIDRAGRIIGRVATCHFRADLITQGFVASANPWTKGAIERAFHALTPAAA